MHSVASKAAHFGGLCPRFIRWAPHKSIQWWLSGRLLHTQYCCHVPSGRQDDFTIFNNFLKLKTKGNIAENKSYSQSARYNVSSESDLPVDNIE